MGCAGLAVANVHQVTQVEFSRLVKIHHRIDWTTVGSGRLSRLPLMFAEVCVRPVSGVLPGTPPSQRAPEGGKYICSGSVLIFPGLRVGAPSSLLPLPSTGCAPARERIPTHLEQTLQRKNQGADRHSPDVSRPDTRREEAGDMMTTTHKLSLSRWALCVSTDTWSYANPSRAQTPGRGKNRGDRTVWGSLTAELGEQLGRPAWRWTAEKSQLYTPGDHAPLPVHSHGG